MSEPVIIREGDRLIEVSPEVAAELEANRSFTGVDRASTSEVANLADQQLNEEVYGGVSGGAAALGLGALRGVTVGLSDPLLAAMGADPEVLAGYQAANPGLSVGGEVVGAIAPAFFTGGSSLGARALAATPAGLVARGGSAVGRAAGGGLRGAAAAGAAEGAFFGMGQGLTNLTITDQELTAEALFSEIGLNGLYGAAFGAAGGLAGEALLKGGKALSDRMAKRSAPTFDFDSEQGRAILRRIDNSSTTITDLAKEIDHVARPLTRATSSNIFDATTTKTIYNQIRREAVNLADTAAKLKVPGVKLADINRVKKAEQRLLDLLSDGSGAINWAKPRGFDTQELRWVQKALRDYEKATVTLGRKMGIDDLDDAFKQAFKDKSPIKTVTSEIDEEVVALSKAVKDSQDQFRAIAGNPQLNRRSIENLSRKDPGEIVDAFLAFDNYGKNLKNLAQRLDSPDAQLAARMDAALEEMQGSLKNVLIDPKTGQAPDAASVLALFGLSEAMIPEFEGPLDDILKLVLAYKALGGGQRGGGARGRLSPLESATRAAASRAGGRVVQKFPAGQSTAGPAGTALSQIRYVAGSRLFTGIVDKFSGGFNQLHNATGRAVTRMDSALQSTLSGTGKAIKRATPVVATSTVLGDTKFWDGVEVERRPKESEKQYAFRQRAAELTAMVGNPEVLQQATHDAAADVRAIHLGVGDALVGHANRTAAFLYDKMPKDPGTLQFFGTSKWRPTEDQVERWGRYIAAAKDPAGIVERMAAGRMSREDAETLRELYPGHFRKVQGWIAENLPAIQQSMPYAQRLMVSRLMEQPADPVSMFNWQDSFIPGEEAQQGAQLQLETSQQPTTAQQLGVKQ